MLADELAEAVADFGAAVVPVRRCRLGLELLRLARRIAVSANETDLLDRADADAVGLAEGAIDCPCFGHSAFRRRGPERDIRGICITKPDEA